MVRTPREAFEGVLNGVTGKRWDELPAFYAEDAVVRHPFLPGGPVLRGRRDLAEHFAAAARTPFEMRAEDVQVHQSTDPEVIVAEFRYVGRFTDTGREFDVPNIFVLRVRDGLIVESRDYADHVTFADAAGRLDDLVSAVARR